MTALVTILPEDREIEAQPEETLLASSLRAGVAHAHACGGRARCSTCRVRIVDGLDECAPRTQDERQMADRFGFDPSVRLACQTRIHGDVVFKRLVLDSDDLEIAMRQSRSSGSGQAAGAERQITVLFADLRGFTQFAESMPPYDVIHVLNRYFGAMGRVIERHGGIINNYMGDGFLALFPGDIQADRDGALDGVAAGLGLLAAMDELRPYLESTYGQLLDIGVGIHVGDVVLGMLATTTDGRLAAIGDAVNFASRIESANKVVGSRLLISDDMLQRVGAQVDLARSVQVAIKGRLHEATLHEVAGLR